MTGKQLELHEDFERAGPARDPRHGLEPREDERDGGARGADARHGDARVGPRRGRRARPRPARRRELPLRAPDAGRRADDEAGRDSRRRAGRARADEPGGTVRFADPIGDGETIHTIHSEMRTFPESFGCREASFRLSLAPALLERLRAACRRGRRGAREAAARALPPSAKTVSSHVVEATAGGRSARVTSFTPPHEEWGLGGGIVSTAAPAAAAVRLLARGAVEARGALPPSNASTPTRSSRSSSVAATGLRPSRRYSHDSGSPEPRNRRDDGRGARVVGRGRRRGGRRRTQGAARLGRHASGRARRGAPEAGRQDRGERRRARRHRGEERRQAAPGVPRRRDPVHGRQPALLRGRRPR